MLNSKIISAGSYLPKKIVTNSDLAQKVDTSDEWIFERTGISQRHIAHKDELTSDLSFEASKNAISKAGIDVLDIDMIILATTTPDLTFPATATIVQAKLGAKNAFAFDIQAVCSGFVYALNIANNFIKTGQVKNALVIGADTLSKIVDWNDRNSCVLFGDGAGAVILSATNDQNSGILSNQLHSDGNLVDILKTSGGIGVSKDSGYIEMSGKEVFKHAVEKMSQCVIKSLEKINLTVDDIDLLVPHQANARILSAVGKKLGLAQEKVIMTVKNHANTSAASIPLALDFALDNNRIAKGDIVVMEALGGGLTWGSIVARW
jgi:3-oxoacyl-[acyl-carrier-protein] synthase-3